MIRKNVVMLGELLSTPGATPRLVSLSPWNPTEKPEFQQGMIATLLPFREELRNAGSSFDDEIGSMVSDELSRCTIQLVKKFSWKDTPVIGSDFANAPRVRLLRYIERVAFGEPAPVEDETYDTAFSESHRGQLRTKFSDLIANIKAALTVEQKSEENRASNVARNIDRGPARDLGSDWKSRYEDAGGDPSKWKLDVLKRYCKEMGMLQSGKKADVVLRVKPHIEMLLYASRE
jgi:hypothetical protein